MSSDRKRLLELLGEMSDRYPNWRFGQIVANVALWARQPTDPDDTGVWHAEDSELLEAIERHLKQSNFDRAETLARFSG